MTRRPAAGTPRHTACSPLSNSRMTCRPQGRLVKQTGASLTEGGWREWSNMPEPPRGGGAGELCVKSCRPKDGVGRARNLFLATSERVAQTDDHGARVGAEHDAADALRAGVQREARVVVVVH